MPRFFLGTFLSTDKQKALSKLKMLNSSLASQWHCDIRWVSPQKLHLTWLFLGNLTDTSCLALCRELKHWLVKNPFPINTLQAQLEKENTSLDFTQLQIWWKHIASRHAVLVPGLDPISLQQVPCLKYINQLRTDMLAYVANEVQGQAQKSFKPHITLMRLKEANNLALPPQGISQKGISQKGISQKGISQKDMSQENSHPFANHAQMHSRTLASEMITGLPQALPISQDLTWFSLIESADEEGGNTYHERERFSLTFD